MAEWQWKRWTAVERIAAGELTMPEAARAVGVSVRQLRRLVHAIKADGQAALQHGNQGRVPANKLAPATIARIVTLRQTTYVDFNDAHFADKLRGETPPLVVSVATVRRILRGAKVPARWQRRAFDGTEAV